MSDHLRKRLAALEQATDPAPIRVFVMPADFSRSEQDTVMDTLAKEGGWQLLGLEAAPVVIIPAKRMAASL